MEMGGDGKRVTTMGGKRHLSVIQLKEKDNRGHVKSITATEKVGRGTILEIGAGGLSFVGTVESVELRSLVCLKNEFALLKKAVDELISKVDKSLGLAKAYNTWVPLKYW